MTHRTFISIILAAALAITGLATTPARAGNDDAAKWIAGAVALGIIGAAISEQRKKDRATTRTRDQDHYRHGSNYPRNDRFKKKVYRDQRFNRGVLPQHCRRVIENRHGVARGFSRRCLLRNYAGFNALPHHCAMQVRTFNGKLRTLYGGHCLRQHGYRVAGSHR